MYRFLRTATVKTAANQAAGLQWAADATAYLNKTYALNLNYGMELFGEGKIYWTFDTDSLDQLHALNTRLLQDREYAGLLEKGKALWVEGSMKDTIVLIAG
jgi:hypothetical protein